MKRSGLLSFGAACAMMVSMNVLGAPEVSLDVRLLKVSASDPDPAIRESAMKALGDLGEKAKPALPELVAALRDADPAVRAAAAKAIGKTNTDSRAAVKALTAALADPSQDTKAFAALALGQLGAAATDAAPALIPLLQTPEYTVQYRVAEALGNIEPRPSVAVPPLLALMRSDKSDVKEAAIKSLGKIVPRIKFRAELLVASKALLAATELPSRDSRLAALAVLDSVVRDLRGEPEMAELMKSSMLRNLKDPDEEVRLSAWQLLEKIVPANELVSSVIAGSRDPDRRIRALLVKNAASVDSVEGAEIVYRGLEDPAANVRLMSFVHASSLKTAKEAVCRRMLGFSPDRDVEVRAAAISTLATCRVSPVELEARLSSAMSDPNPQVRVAALTAVPATTPLAAKLVLQGLDDSESSVRTAATGRVLELSPMPVESIPQLVAAVQGTDAAAATVAAQALATYGTKASAASPALERHMMGANEKLKEAAIETYGFVAPRDPSSLPPLLAAIKTSDEAEAAIEALGRQSSLDDASMTSLIERVSRSVSAETWHAGIWALSSRGESALTAIRRMLATAEREKKERPADNRPKSAMASIFDASDRTTNLGKLLTALEAAQKTHSLDAIAAQEGKPSKVVAGPRHAVIAMATWCPHSRKFAEFLSRESTQRMTEGWTFSFVFADESGALQQRGERGGDAHRMREREALKARSGGTVIYDPVFLSTLSGQVYFMEASALEEAFGDENPSFPSVYVPANKKFELDGKEWAIKKAKLPDWLLQRVTW